MNNHPSLARDKGAVVYTADVGIPATAGLQVGHLLGLLGGQ